MRSIGRAFLGVTLLLVASAAWAAKPYTAKCPEEDRNVLDVRMLRALVAERCDCTAAPSHGAYIACVSREVKALAASRGDARACRRVVVAFERRSPCGRSGRAICCRATETGASETTVRDAGRCAERGGVACACGDASGSLCAHSVHDACTPAATCTAADDDGDPSVVHSHLLPSQALLMSWIEDIVAQGIRRPGYPADDWTIDWAAERFADLGLDVRLDPIEVRRWQPNRCALAVWPQASPEARESIPCFAVPYSTPTAGLVAPLAAFTDGADLSGRIAVVDNTFLRLPQTVMVALFATDHYDPLGEFATLAQTLPFSSRFQNVMEPAIAAGAAGFIGILDGLPWETDQYYVPYDALQRPIPGVWLSQSNGARLRALLAAGPVDGEVIVEADVGPTTSYNVIGTLPGASPEWVIIGSHHDGPWASAVEDASGVAMVLGQALYWSQVPAAERPHNLLFLLNGGHMTGGAGLIDFVTRNADWLDEVVLEVHLEHIAREGRGENGRLVPTDRPEVRWWFTTEIPPLQAAVKQAIVREGLDRSLIMAPDGFPPGSVAPPTDGAFFHPAGVPMVNLLAAPMYLFDAADTVEMIHEESLVPASRAAARIVAWTRGQTAAGMRAGTLP
jgi:hypothetical protein